MHGCRARFPFVIIALALSGCASEHLAPTSSALSEAEATPLARAIVARFLAFSDESGSSFALTGATQAGDRFGTPGAAHQAGPRDSLTVVETSEVSGPCEDDRGTARLVSRLRLRIDAETTSGTAEGDLTLFLAQCAIITDTGRRFTVTSEPNITLHADFTLANGEPVGETVASRVTGTFSWQHDNRHGQCDVDLTVTTFVASGLLRAQGDFCGIVVDQTL